jgi:hypothetical protein
MNFLARLGAVEGTDFVRSFVDGGWNPVEWRSSDGQLLSMEPTSVIGEYDDAMARFRVSLTISSPGDATSRVLMVREDGAVLSEDGEADFAAEFFDFASRAQRAEGE